MKRNHYKKTYFFLLSTSLFHSKNPSSVQAYYSLISLYLSVSLKTSAHYNDSRLSHGCKRKLFQRRREWNNGRIVISSLTSATEMKKVWGFDICQIFRATSTSNQLIILFVLGEASWNQAWENCSLGESTRTFAACEICSQTFQSAVAQFKFSAHHERRNFLNYIRWEWQRATFVILMKKTSITRRAWMEFQKGGAQSWKVRMWRIIRAIKLPHLELSFFNLTTAGVPSSVAIFSICSVELNFYGAHANKNLIGQWKN